MRIYVAGHTGMLGSAIVRALKTRDGVDDIVVSHYHYRESSEGHWGIDLTDPMDIDRIFKKYQPDYVFMAAGRVGGIQANLDNQAAMLADNARMAMNVVDACAEYGAKLCYIGSSCMYPRDCPQPMIERDLMRGAFEPTNEGYALAKMVGLKYAQWRLPDSVCAIPCNLYGQGDNYDPQTSHVFPALIKKFVDAKDADTPFVTLWGSGYAKREFLHTDDCAAALVTLMEQQQTGIINIGSGEEVSINALAHLIADIVGYSGTIEWDTRHINGMPRKIMDSKKMRSLGWRHRIALWQGIEQTIAEYRALKPKDEWYSTDGKTWKNDARPNQPIESDPHANLTGQVIKDKDGKVIARARGM